MSSQELKTSPPGNAVDTDERTLADMTPATAPSLDADPEKNASDGNDKDTDGSTGDAADVEDSTGANLAQAVSVGYGSVPDGGLQAWLVVFGAWCTSFCSFGWINSVGIFQAYYESGPLSSYSSSTIAWIPSLQIFFMFAMGPIIGRIFDAYGPRYLVCGGALMHVFGLMMASISTKYYQYLLSQGVCSAIGVSAIFQPALSCIPGWFGSRRGLAYGVLSTGSSLGGVIFPIMVNRLIDQIGYPWAMRACAFMILGLLICAALTVRSRIHEHPNFVPGNSLPRDRMLAPLREPPFLILLAAMVLLTFGIFVPIDYISSAALATGNFSHDLAQYTVSILNAASLFGRLLSGWASDSLGKYNTFTSACTLAGISVLAIWIPATSKAGTIAFACIFGFTSGAYISLIASLVAQVTVPKEIGYRSGLMFVVAAVPGLVTSPIAGAILGDDNWTGVKIFAGVLLLAGSAVAAIARFAYADWRTKVF